jgi:hypothetical protein
MVIVARSGSFTLKSKESMKRTKIAVYPRWKEVRVKTIEGRLELSGRRTNKP